MSIEACPLAGAAPRMTARSSTPEKQRADEMRARILTNVEAWIVLRRPRRHRFDPAEYSITDDHRGLLLALRDPRALELEYEQHRVDFWDERRTAGEVRLIARRAVVLARELAKRALDPERERVA